MSLGIQVNPAAYVIIIQFAHSAAMAVATTATEAAELAEMAINFSPIYSHYKKI